MRSERFTPRRVFVVVVNADGGLLHVELGSDYRVNIEFESHYREFTERNWLGERIYERRIITARGSVLGMGWQDGAPDFSETESRALPEPEVLVNFTPPTPLLEFKPGGENEAP